MDAWSYEKEYNQEADKEDLWVAPIEERMKKMLFEIV